MHNPRVILAGFAFGAVREYLQRAMPETRIDAIDIDRLNAHGAAGEVLIPMMSRIDGPLMNRVRDLRLIQQWGAGLDGVDIEAASARGIAVANVPTAESGNADSVAEWCVMAALALSRRLPQMADSMRAGAPWGVPCGQALRGRTAGIVGLGGIGQALAARLRPFGMRMMGLQRRPDLSLIGRIGLEWVGGIHQLPELLRESNYLFLCVPLTDETRGFIDAKAISLLPPDSCVINAGRGALLRETALLDALESGHLMGAALDVYQSEPLDPGSRLLGRLDVLTTPHIAGVTDVSYAGISRVVADNIQRVMSGGSIRHCVNSTAMPIGRSPR